MNILSEKNIQEKIKEDFISTISKSSRFTAKEVEEIEKTIALPQKVDKMVDSILKSIGGLVNEDT